MDMAGVGQIEKKTQRCVVKMFREQIGFAVAEDM